MTNWGSKGILQDWLRNMPLRHQGVVILALRGPDGIRKESAVKPIIRALRACVMNAGRTGAALALEDHDDKDPFMSMINIGNEDKWTKATEEFFNDIDQYNIHFFQHLIHCAAALGWNYPVPEIASRWLNFYYKACHKLHVVPESREAFSFRLRDGKRSDAENK